jgi:DNA recombination protein RmuC
METVILMVVVGATTGALGLVLGRYLCPAPKSADQIALSTAQADAKRLATETIEAKARAAALGSWGQQKSDALQEEEKKSARLEERVAALALQIEEQARGIATATAAQAKSEGELKAAAENAARLTEREVSLTKEVRSLEDQLREEAAAHNKAIADSKTSGEEVARLTERGQALAKEAAALRAQESRLHEILKAEFENIATKVLKANSTELSETSQKQIAAILDPLRDRIQEFQGKVENTYDTEKREVLSLKEQIRLMAETSQNLGSQADRFAKALKGDVQMLGRWGELVLERILQGAGLKEGREYITQGHDLGLKSETGGSQKLGVIVLLPEGRTMIVDANVSLASYDRLITTEEEAERLEHATQFVRDVKVHIDGLSGKRYQDSEQILSHECVLMFVPIEGAVAAALTAEPELFTYAWDKRVVLVGPSTLLMTLRTVASIWRSELQAQNAQDIAKLAGVLCDKVSASLGDLNTIADRMNQALAAHSEAVKRLSTGKGNALVIGERIRRLGVKTINPTPVMLVDGERITAELEFEENPEISSE